MQAIQEYHCNFFPLVCPLPHFFSPYSPRHILGPYYTYFEHVTSAMGYVTGYLTWCETLGTFYLACYMPIDTHNMRDKKNKKTKNDCGLFEKWNVHQHIAPGKGQSNYITENQAGFEGCKT
jgi:hypothetical protein